MPEARQGKKKDPPLSEKTKKKTKYYLQKEIIISGDFITTSLWLYKNTKIVSKVYATKFY